VPFFQNFYEEQCSQNPPQYLSGLSRALFPTTFFEIAVFEVLVEMYEVEGVELYWTRIGKIMAVVC